MEEQSPISGEMYKPLYRMFPQQTQPELRVPDETSVIDTMGLSVLITMFLEVLIKMGCLQFLSRNLMSFENLSFQDRT
jgi:hypothetical protein